MGFELSRPSRTYRTYYLPSDTIIRRSHPNGSSEWWYINPSIHHPHSNGVGPGMQQQRRNMFDCIDQAAMGGPWPFAWKNARDWTERDFGVLGDVLEEYYARRRGREMGGFAAPGYRGMHQQRHHGQHDFDHGAVRQQDPYGYLEAHHESLEEHLRAFRRQAREYKQQMDSVNDLLFGSEAERRREAFNHNMMRNLQSMFPQLVQMMQQQQQYGMGTYAPGFRQMGGMPAGLPPYGPRFDPRIMRAVPHPIDEEAYRDAMRRNSDLRDRRLGRRRLPRYRDGYDDDEFSNDREGYRPGRGRSWRGSSMDGNAGGDYEY